MTSKTKKKAQSSTRVARDTPGKKARKKVRRRTSLGQTDAQDNSESQSSIEFATSASMIDLGIDPYGKDSSEKMTSCRTMATELSSSHHSSDQKSLQSPRKSPKKGSKKSKNLKEIDGQWWHIDDDGIPVNKSHRKKKGADRLSQTEHLPSTSSSVITPVSVKKKKKKGSKSVRHLSSNNTDLGYGSGHESPLGGTVNTTGTGSLRPKPRRLKSQPDMGVSFDQYESPQRLGGGNSRSMHNPRLSGLERSPSADLDMLMSQSVHEHVRKTPASAEKPKLGKSSKSTLGKIGKKLGKSCKALGISSKNMSVAKDSYHNNDSEQTRSRSGHDSTVKSSVSGLSNKPLPKDIREIDGIFWRVDQYGNKLNKVRRKNPNRNNQNSWSSGDETDIKSQASQEMSDYRYSNSSFPTWSSDDGSGDSFADCLNSPRMKGKRRNSMGSHGKHSPKQPDSERSIYTDLNDLAPKTPKGRSKSMNHIDGSPIPQNSKRDEQSCHTPRRQSKKEQVVVQNLQHRLKNSEKEIARLCRVTMDQQNKIDESKTEVKKIRDKLKLANRDKQSLIMEVESLKLQIEKRKERSNKSLNGTTADELREQVCDLEDEKELLEKQLATEKEMTKHRLQAKEEEVRFLQEELERMRSEHGDKQFAYMQKMAMSDDEDTMHSNGRTSSPQRRRNGAGKSLQFVGKILGNHLKDKAETEVALQQEEIRNLQARVFSLQQSNEKLTKELKQATLEIKEDDDADVRLAKEAAARAAEVASMHNPKNDLKSKVMSLSRIHRSNSEGDNESLSLSFRGGVGDCVRRRGSIGGGGASERSSSSFRVHGTSGLY